MIYYADDSNEALLFIALDIEHIYGSRIYTLYKAYNNVPNMVDIWVYLENDKPLGAIMRFSGILTIVADESADLSEIASFIHIVGGFNQIEGLLYTVLELNKFLNLDIETGLIMCYQGTPYNADNQNINRNPVYKEVFDILCKSDVDFEIGADYDNWLLDISHRTRRGLAKMITYEHENIPVASAGIYFIGRKISVIGGVATLPEYRHQGFATKAVKAITAYAIEDGRLPVLIPADENLVPFYTSLGYGEVGQRGILFK